jgi:hypothetical protein
VHVCDVDPAGVLHRDRRIRVADDPAAIGVGPAYLFRGLLEQLGSERRVAILLGLAQQPLERAQAGRLIGNRDLTDVVEELRPRGGEQIACFVGS